MEATMGVTNNLEIDFDIPSATVESFLLTEINKLLETRGFDQLQSIDQLDDYEVYVEIPGGGDWSNMSLPVLCKGMCCRVPLKVRAKHKINL